MVGLSKDMSQLPVRVFVETLPCLGRAREAHTRVANPTAHQSSFIQPL